MRIYIIYICYIFTLTLMFQEPRNGHECYVVSDRGHHSSSDHHSGNSISTYVEYHIYLHQRFSKGKILHSLSISSTFKNVNLK